MRWGGREKDIVLRNVVCSCIGCGRLRPRAHYYCVFHYTLYSSIDNNNNLFHVLCVCVSVCVEFSIRHCIGQIWSDIRSWLHCSDYKTHIVHSYCVSVYIMCGRFSFTELSVSENFRRDFCERIFGVQHFVWFVKCKMREAKIKVIATTRGSESGRERETQEKENRSRLQKGQCGEKNEPKWSETEMCFDVLLTWNRYQLGKRMQT